MLIDRLAQPFGLGQALVGKRFVAESLRQRAEFLQRIEQEKGQPNALALAFETHQVHAVVPVARAHQGQTLHAFAQAISDGAHAVLVERGAFLAHAGQVVIRVFFGVEGTTFQKRRTFLQHLGVTGRQHITAGARVAPG
jgi:hypothetical protein